MGGAVGTRANLETQIYNIMTNEQKFEEIITRLAPVLANAAVNWTLENYNKQQWEGTPWKARKSKKDTGRAILIGPGSGRLRRSIQVVTIGNLYAIGVLGVPYARIHNEGGEITQAARSELFVRNRYKKGAKGKMFGGMGAYKKGTTKGKGLSFKQRTITIPKRQFIGNNAAMRQYMVAEGQSWVNKQ